MYSAENTTDGFVYAASAPFLSAAENLSHIFPQEIQLLPSLSRVERLLLHHFTHDASRITCCSSHVQMELCQLILPMAIYSSSLMHATLAWAAIHYMSFKGSIDGISNPERFIASLKAKSIESLRFELERPQMANRDSLLATVRTLCQAEIHSGSDDASSWRIHVKGAKALMNAIKKSENPNGTRSRLLERWYTALDSLAALTPQTQLVGEDDVHSDGVNEAECAEDYYLDDYNGYSTDLSMMIGKIGGLAKKMHQLYPQNLEDFAEQVDQLESSVYRIMARDNTSPPIFYPGVVEKLSPQAIRQYSLCNQAYQHTALIHIQRRLRQLPIHTPQIQHSVKQIIQCVRGIAPSYGLSPANVLTTPLFTAGCEAQGDDRDAIRELLNQIYHMLKIRNIKLTLEVLETHWSSDAGEGDWKNLLRK
jgi:hypothetical protein